MHPLHLHPPSHCPWLCPLPWGMRWEQLQICCMHGRMQKASQHTCWDSSLTQFHRNRRTGQNRGGISHVGWLFGPTCRFEVLDHSATWKAKLPPQAMGWIPLCYAQIQHSGQLITVETVLSWFFHVASRLCLAIRLEVLLSASALKKC